MKHLRLFETESDYESAKSETEYPSISYIEDTQTTSWKQENYLIATYNVTSTSTSTQVLGSDFHISQVKAMYVDGKEITPSATYQFDSTSEHKVKIVFNSSFNSAMNMLKDCRSLTSLDLSNFDTSNVTKMGGMFQSCKSLTSLDLSPLDTSKVTDMSGMFSRCSSLTSLDLSPLDTSNVTNMSSMFNDCSSLTSLDLSPLDTSNVTNMSSMFSWTSLTSLDLSPLDTSKVNDMRSMFSSCRSLTSLDLSNFDTSKVTYMSSMFYNCSSLTQVTMMGDVSNVIYNDNPFDGITTNGTFYYNSAYDYSKIIAALPSTWTAVAV